MKTYLYYLYGPTGEHAGYYCLEDDEGNINWKYAHQAMEDLFFKTHVARQGTANE